MYDSLIHKHNLYQIHRESLRSIRDIEYMYSMSLYSMSLVQSTCADKLHVEVEKNT